MHTSVTASISATILGFFMMISSTIANPITEGIDDFNVLDVQDSIPGIAEIFYVVLEAFIILLLISLEGFSSRWMLVRALKVQDEHGTKLVSVVDGTFGQVDELRSGHAGQCRG
jgi:hypothetical protein